MTTPIPPNERIQWWLDARFGMFLHWGMYSVLGRGEQIMSRDLIPPEEYEPVAAQFQPPADWAPKLARQIADTGAKYVVLTTRHHDGYCLFDTATHDFNAAKTGPGRDLIAEYADAMRAAGLRVGLYYSLMNWRWAGTWDAEEHADDLPRMVDEIHTQVRELMSNYGRIDILWYDTPIVPGLRVPGQWHGKGMDMSSEKFYRSVELNGMVRELQPHILINNRSGRREDFGTPEQKIGGEGGSAHPWETCMTINNAPGWGYMRHCSANKSAAEVLNNLMDAVRLGGNFLFNVGPRPDGSIDAREGEVLKDIGDWMRGNGDAVYGTRPTGIYDASAAHPQGAMYHYGMWTCRGAKAWFSIFRYPGDELVVSKITPAPRSAKLLATGEELELVPASNSRTIVRGLPATPPDPLATVIEFEFDEPPRELDCPGASWLSGRYG